MDKPRHPNVLRTWKVEHIRKPAAPKKQPAPSPRTAGQLTTPVDLAQLLRCDEVTQEALITSLDGTGRGQLVASYPLPDSVCVRPCYEPLGFMDKDIIHFGHGKFLLETVFD